MIAARDLEGIALFADAAPPTIQALARRAADVQVEPGGWLIREGEDPRLFIVLEGTLDILKNVIGLERVIASLSQGEFFGETALLMGTDSIVSLRAQTRCRVARFERQHMQEIMRDVPSAAQLLFNTIQARLLLAHSVAASTPSSRVHIAGSMYQGNCRAIRAFLSANRIPYDWQPDENVSEESVAISVGGVVLEDPTVRSVAEALGFQTVPHQQQYDVIIAGAGPAGLAAAIYCASEGLRVLVVERFAAGGQAGTSSRIENYFGFSAGIAGDDLTARALRQAERFGVELVVQREISEVQNNAGRHTVVLAGGDQISAPVLLLTTGVSWHVLSFQGHDEFLNRGITYGASRFDGVAVSGERVFIVGGGNSAGQAAVFYSAYASEVVILVRGSGLAQSMSQYLIEQIREKANIRVEPFTEVVAVRGDTALREVLTQSRAPGSAKTSMVRSAKALFIMIGATARTEWLPAALQRDSSGYICTGRDVSCQALVREPFALETSIPGIFCAGDVRAGSIKRVASGVGEGSMAVAYIHQYLELLKDSGSHGSN